MLGVAHTRVLLLLRTDRTTDDVAHALVLAKSTASEHLDCFRENGVGHAPLRPKDRAVRDQRAQPTAPRFDSRGRQLMLRSRRAASASEISRANRRVARGYLDDPRCWRPLGLIRQIDTGHRGSPWQGGAPWLPEHDATLEPLLEKKTADRASTSSSSGTRESLVRRDAASLWPLAETEATLGSMVMALE